MTPDCIDFYDGESRLDWIALTGALEAGQTDHKLDLILIDDDWRRNTADVIAAQMRDAGMKVKRTVIPGNTFWNDLTKYPASITNWNPRPRGVQVLALAYRSSEPWNESAFNNAEFDGRSPGPEHWLNSAVRAPDQPFSRFGAFRSCHAAGRNHELRDICVVR
jgi:hypothetical protein